MIRIEGFGETTITRCYINQHELDEETNHSGKKKKKDYRKDDKDHIFKNWRKKAQ